MPTGRDEKGNILVHFARLPDADAAGCWYYNAARQAWAWAAPGIGSGIDRPRFPACAGRLRSRLAAAAELGFGPVEVSRAVDAVRLRAPEQCGSPLWNPFPRAAPGAECGVEEPTGLTGAGRLVVHWHPDYLPADDSVCWILTLETAEWEFFYRK